MADCWQARGRHQESLFASSRPAHFTEVECSKQPVSSLSGVSWGKAHATGGSLCLRFAVHYMTNASARDLKASFEQQRH